MVAQLNFSLEKRTKPRIGLAATFFAQAEISPQKIAVHCEEQEISYQALAHLVAHWSKAMLEHGVKRGEHIGVLLPNNIEFVALMLVAANLGVALVPLNTSLTADAVHRALSATEVKHLVSNAAILHALLSSEVDFEKIDGLWLAIDKDESNKHSKIIALKTLLDGAVTENKALQMANENDAFILTMTSGSTGDPKPILLTQRTKYSRAMSAQTLYNITDNDITLAATPLYHSLAERLVLIPLLTGGTAIVMARYSPTEWLKHVQQHKITFTIAVSSQLKQIAEVLNSEQWDTSSLRCIVSSSALLEAKIKSALMKQLHCEFHECYGTSEIAIASNLNGKTDTGKVHSVGSAILNVDIKILDKNNKVVSTGEVGEIVCKTDMLFGGYYKRPELTKAAMWGDYFRTGDMGQLDGDGYLYYVSRKKDIIISGGINIYPSDIENVIKELPNVQECAAFAYKDKQLGEVVAVALVPTDFTKNSDNAIEPNSFNLKKARHHCAAHLADFQQPRKWFLLEALPKNSLGKVMKFQLVNMYNNA